ncbi:MAG: branched-chain amino acid ABC transporter permease [Anaerolineaceae bacterium]|nr:branched-chain amino acid ABC transporter permease [Anaerolineaceae bacterium]
MSKQNSDLPIKKHPLMEKGLLIFVLVLLAFPFVFSLVSGTGLNAGLTKFWQGQLIDFFIMAVFAMSYDLLIGYAGVLSFGHAASFGGGAYAAGLLLKFLSPKVLANPIMIGSFNFSWILMLLIVLVVVLLVSILIGLLFSATSIRLKGAYFAMLTLALAGAINILSKATDFVKWTGADEGMHALPVPPWMDPTQNRLTFYFIALAVLLVSFYLMRRMVLSPAGSVVVATRENEDRTRMIGYNPIRYRTLAFVSASIFAGFAGALYAMWTTSATPSMTSATMTVNALIMTILGGLGTLVGPLMGAGIMQIVGQFFYTWFGARWPLVFGVLFILIVMFLPYGIVGTWRLRKQNLKEGWQRLLGLLNLRNNKG